jgi:hypothetical protein
MDEGFKPLRYAFFILSHATSLGNGSKKPYLSG